MSFKRHNQAITLWRARLSFPNLFEAKPIIMRGQEVGAPRFSVIVLPTPEQCQQIYEIENWLIAQSWPDGVPQGVQIKRALISGDVHRPGDPNLAGKMLVTANAKQDSPPQIVSIHRDATGHFPPLTDRHYIYSGCEANVGVGLYTTQLKVSEPQINVGLNSVQPTEREMDRFDNRPTADQTFGADPYAGDYAQAGIQPGAGQPWQQGQQQPPAQGQPQQPPQYPWQQSAQGQPPAQGQPQQRYPWQQGPTK